MMPSWILLRQERLRNEITFVAQILGHRVGGALQIVERAIGAYVSLNKRLEV